jgi:hypothetical protein
MIYYANNDKEISKPVTTIADGDKYIPQKSMLQARGRQPEVARDSQMLTEGIPGIPFQEGSPNPDVFYQGDDIVYDAYLFFKGSPVTSEKYTILVSVKSSPRAVKTLWEGTIEDGVAEIKTAGPGYFEIWLPAASTAQAPAGSYYMAVWVKERFAAGGGKYDRSGVIAENIFHIAYSIFSPLPETVSPEGGGGLRRDTIERTWPPSPPTIGI